MQRGHCFDAARLSNGGSHAACNATARAFLAASPVLPLQPSTSQKSFYHPTLLQVLLALTLNAYFLQAKREASDSAAKEAFYREALQELTLFKSRTSASLLQAQEQLQSATREAEAMEATYQTAWQTAQANHTKNTALLAQLSEVSNLPAVACPSCGTNIGLGQPKPVAWPAHSVLLP